MFPVFQYVLKKRMTRIAMIKHNIEHYAHTHVMRSCNEFNKVCVASELRIDSPVTKVVLYLMITVRLENGSQITGVYTEIFQIRKFLGNTF